MIKVDMWHKNKLENIDGFNIIFNDESCFYCGNFYIDGTVVGDFYAETIQELKETLPHLAEKIEASLN